MSLRVQLSVQAHGHYICVICIWVHPFIYVSLHVNKGYTSDVQVSNSYACMSLYTYGKSYHFFHLLHIYMYV